MEAAKPEGREAVRAALLEATVEALVEEGLSTSVRSIAARAGVNHGLVHQYFGGKPQLLAEALEEVNRRAVADLDEDGLPPLDLVSRRNGELPRVLARLTLEEPRSDPFRSHPVVTSWRAALVRLGRAESEAQAAEMIALSSALAIGWSLMDRSLLAALGADEATASSINAAVQQRVAELGGLAGPAPTDVA